jgi:hypothetical protein
MAVFSYTQLPVIGESSSAAASHIITSFTQLATQINGTNVDYSNIANDAVRTTSIQNGSVTFAKLDSTAGSQAVQTSVIKDGAVTFAKLDSTSGSEAVQTSVIKDASVTLAKIAPAAQIVHYSSGLPAGTSWTDGQKITIPAPGVNGGVWMFQWSSTETTPTTPTSTTGAWMFIGGPPASASTVAAGFSTAAYTTNGAAAFTTPAAITLPNKGLYEIYAEGVLSFDSSSGTSAGAIGGKFGHGLGAGTTGATDMESIGASIVLNVSNVSYGHVIPTSVNTARLIQTTNTPVSLFGRTNAANRTLTCSNAALRITPIKLLP